MLLKLIKNKNIAVVGPSSSLDNKNFGKLIDSHDIVIKINRFQDLSPKDCGKRMDILFFNFWKIIPNNSITTYETKLIVGGHPFTGFSLSNKINLQRSEKIYDKITHEYFPKNELSIDMKKIINKDCWKSSGFWMICLLLNKINIIKQLNIFGLDFLFHKYNKKYNSRNNTSCHNMNSELSLFKELFQKYKDNKKLVIHDKEFLDYLNK